MRGQDLTLDQLTRLHKSLRPKLVYMERLRKRMEANNFPDHDRLYRDVVLAHDMLKDLVMEITTMLSYRGFYKSMPK